MGQRSDSRRYKADDKHGGSKVKQESRKRDATRKQASERKSEEQSRTSRTEQVKWRNY